MLPQSPLPYFRDAAESARRIFELKRDLAVLDAERQAIRQAKRIAFGVMAYLCASTAFILAIFWASWAMYEAGYAPWSIAGYSLLLFGGLAAILSWLALRGGLISDKRVDESAHAPYRERAQAESEIDRVEMPASLTRRTREEAQELANQRRASQAAPAAVATPKKEASR